MKEFNVLIDDDFNNTVDIMSLDTLVEDSDHDDQDLELSVSFGTKPHPLLSSTALCPNKKKKKEILCKDIPIVKKIKITPDLENNNQKKEETNVKFNERMFEENKVLEGVINIFLNLGKLHPKSLF